MFYYCNWMRLNKQPNPKSTERNLNTMSTALSYDPFQGLRLFEDAVTRLMS
jgi:cytochrome c